MRNVMHLIPVILAASTLSFACGGTSTQQAGTTPDTRAVGTAGTRTASDSRDDVVTTSLFRNIVKRENPVVVSITTQSRVRTPDLDEVFGGDDDFFRRFFGAPRLPREHMQRALGSGFIISGDGEILTNNHVVAGAEQIRVGLFGDERTTYNATVIGRDPLTDSALIQLESGPGTLPTADLGDSDALEPGDWVVAIGNPFRLGHTVTVGVVSYKARPFAVTEGRFQNMLQTDASINPGNSGGPLIDVHGSVVGINSAILAGEDGEGNIGIGFAVPINTVKALLPSCAKDAFTARVSAFKCTRH
jgi:S1-C subfamily serine protease